MVLAELHRLGDLYLDHDQLESNLTLNYDLTLQKERLLKDIQIYRQKAEECTKALCSLYLDKVKNILSRRDLSRCLSAKVTNCSTKFA